MLFRSFKRETVFRSNSDEKKEAMDVNAMDILPEKLEDSEQSHAPEERSASFSHPPQIPAMQHSCDQDQSFFFLLFIACFAP